MLCDKGRVDDLVPCKYCVSTVGPLCQDLVVIWNHVSVLQLIGYVLHIVSSSISPLPFYLFAEDDCHSRINP